MGGGGGCLSFVVVGEEDSAGAELEDEGQEKEEDEGDDEGDEDVDEDKDKEEVRSALG